MSIFPDSSSVLSFSTLVTRQDIDAALNSIEVGDVWRGEFSQGDVEKMMGEENRIHDESISTVDQLDEEPGDEQ